MQNYLSRSTVQDGREATTRTSSLYLRAFLTCAENQSWSLSLTRICARANPVVVAHPTPFRRHFNLRKADWDGNSTELDKLLEDVEPIPENYGVFVDKVCVASRMYIPRGCRTNHIFSLSEESKSLYEEYKKQYASDPFDNGTIETGNALMNNMKEEKKKRWEEVITSTNMTHNSRKAWKIIKHLSNDPTSPIAPC